jgi:hypothetical protein
LKASLKNWKFGHWIRSSTTRSKKTMNPNTFIVSQKASKISITNITKRRAIRNYFNIAFRRGMLSNMTNYMLLICWTKSMNHGQMIWVYVID